MKVLIVTSSPYGIVSSCFEQLIESDIVHVVGVVVAGPRRLPPMTKLRKKIAKARRIGPLGALNGLRLRRWFAETRTHDLRTLCRRAGVECLEAAHIDSGTVRDFIRRARPDLGCSINNGYIPESIFSLPRFGMVNLHGERLPAYQNAHSVIWAIHNQERQTGLTIHQMDARIDTGAILHQEEWPIEFGATLCETVKRTLPQVRKRAPRALRYVCEHYEALRETAAPQTNGTSYTTPSIRAFLRMSRNNKSLYGAEH